MAALNTERLQTKGNPGLTQGPDMQMDSTLRVSEPHPPSLTFRVRTTVLASVNKQT